MSTIGRQKPYNQLKYMLNVRVDYAGYCVGCTELAKRIDREMMRFVLLSASYATARIIHSDI